MRCTCRWRLTQNTAQRRQRRPSTSVERSAIASSAIERVFAGGPKRIASPKPAAVPKPSAATTYGKPKVAASAAAQPPKASAAASVKAVLSPSPVNCLSAFPVRHCPFTCISRSQQVSAAPMPAAVSVSGDTKQPVVRVAVGTAALRASHCALLLGVQLTASF